MPKEPTTSHGTTSQQWSTGGGIVNSAAQQAHGSPIREHVRAGYYAPGQPSGNSAASIVPGGAIENNILTARGYPAPLAISTPYPLTATHGSPYSQQIAASGGSQAGLVWSLATGSALPGSGLSLSSSGLISGTPPAAASGTFWVRVVDSVGNNAAKMFTLVIN